MLLVQNLMLEKLADKDVQLTKDQIVTQVLGTRPGYVRGMGKFVISTPSSSRSHYETEVDNELETYKQELSKIKQQLKGVQEAQCKLEETQKETRLQLEESQRQIRRL